MMLCLLLNVEIKSLSSSFLGDNDKLSLRLLRVFFQGIISIVYIVGVNPMAQGSSAMMYNPMLMMCQNLYQTNYAQMGGVGGFPIYNQYLYHYCFVDPQEVSEMR